MIRLNQRKLIIPRGDTGEFSVPLLSSFTDGDIAVFAIFNTINKTIIFSKQIVIQGERVVITLSHNQTVNLPTGKYTWDIKLYNNPQYVDDILVNGNQISSYNAGFVNFPTCQIVETADNYLLADDAPTSTLTPAQLDIITAAIEALNDALQKTADNVSHYPKIQDHIWFVWDAESGEYVNTGESAGGQMFVWGQGKGAVKKAPVTDGGLIYSSTASGINSFAIGYKNKATGKGSTGIGLQTTAKGEYSLSEGYNTQATGNYSHAEGSGTTAYGGYSHAEGISTNASGQYAHAEGSSSTASGQCAHAEGTSVAYGPYSHSEGGGTRASGEYSHTQGNGSIALGQYAHAEGSGSNASGMNSHAEGNSTQADGVASHSEGVRSKVTGNYSHAEGEGTTVSADSSHAEGIGARAAGYGSHAEGGGTNATAEAAHAEGTGTTASGFGSHAEGGGTVASGYNSHTEGEGTRATESCSHAEGGGTLASGPYCHAEGEQSQALGRATHSEGVGTKTAGYAVNAKGKYNIQPQLIYEKWQSGKQYNIDDIVIYGERPLKCIQTTSSTTFRPNQWQWLEDIKTTLQQTIVGNGTGDNNRSNAYVLNWDGSGWYASTVSAGTVNNPAVVQNNNDLTTKYYVDSSLINYMNTNIVSINEVQQIIQAWEV